MNRYYRVLKDTFLWEKGAILKHNGVSNEGYVPIEDIWDKVDNQDEYISTELIENNPEWFERVYPNNLEKLIFRTKDQFKKSVKFIR